MNALAVGTNSCLKRGVLRMKSACFLTRVTVDILCGVGGCFLLASGGTWFGLRACLVLHGDLLLSFPFSMYPVQQGMCRPSGPSLAKIRRERTILAAVIGRERSRGGRSRKRRRKRR